MTQKAIILSNGDIDDLDLTRLRLLGWEDAMVIGADAGTRHAEPLGLTLSLMIGDFDSLDPASRRTLEAQGIAVKVHPPEKNEIDLELALIAAVERGADHIVIIGATGGRIDMTLASILLLSHPILLNTHTEIWVDRQSVWLLRPPGGEIQGDEGDTISLIPVGGDATSIHTEHLAYPLNNESLSFGPARGVSNVMTAPIARVTFASGLILVIHTPGRA